MLIHLLPFPSQGLFTSSSHLSPAVRGLGISTLSHSRYLLSEFSLSPFSGVCITEDGAGPFPLPAVYLNAFLRCPPKLLAFPSLPPPAMKVATLSSPLQSLNAAGTGLATFCFDNFPWEIDFPLLFLLLVLCSGQWSPETSSSSSSLFSSFSFRGSSEGRSPSRSWRLVTQSQSLSKSLSKSLVLLRLTQETVGRLSVLNQNPCVSHLSKKGEDITVLQPSRSFPLPSSSCSSLPVSPSAGLGTLRVSSSGCLCSAVWKLRNTWDEHHRRRKSYRVSSREELGLL